MFGGFNNGSWIKGNEGKMNGLSFSFGSRSSNNNNANNNSLFGSGSNLFNSGNDKKETESKNVSGLLVNNNNNPFISTASSNMFGSNNNNNNNPFGQAVPTNLFGANNKKEAESKNIGSLFTTTNVPANQPCTPNFAGGNEDEKEPKNNGSLFNNVNNDSTSLFGNNKEENKPNPTGSLFGNSFTQTVNTNIPTDNKKEAESKNTTTSFSINNNNLPGQKTNSFSNAFVDNNKKENVFTTTGSFMNNNNNNNNGLFSQTTITNTFTNFNNNQKQNKPTPTLFGQQIQNNKPTTGNIFSPRTTNIIPTQNTSEEPKQQPPNSFNQPQSPITTTKVETEENNFVVASSPFSNVAKQNNTFIKDNNNNNNNNNTFFNTNNTQQTEKKSSLPFELISPFDNQSPTLTEPKPPSQKQNQITILKDILIKLQSPLSNITTIQQTLLNLSKSIQKTVASIDELIKPIETKQFTKTTQYYSTLTSKFTSITPKELFTQIQKHSSSIESLLTENYHTQLTNAMHSFINDITNNEPYTKGLKTLTYINKQDTYYGNTHITISKEGQQQIFKEGFGVLKFKTGNAFIGEFVQDKQTQGIYVTPSAIIISSNYTTVNINQNENDSSKEVINIAKDSLVIQHTKNIIYIGDFNMDTSTPYETKGHLIKLTSNENKTFLFSSKHTKLYYNIKDNKGYIKITPEEKTSFQTDFETYLIKDVFRSFTNSIIYFSLYYMPKDIQHPTTHKPIYIGKLIKKKNSLISHPEFQPHSVNDIHESNFDEGKYNALIYPNDSIYIGSVSKGNYLIKNGNDCLIYYKENDMVLYNAVIENNQIKKGKVCKSEEFSSVKKQLEFEGEFRNSKPVKGVVMFGNGSRYEGDVNESFMMHGKGVFYYEGNKMVYEGMFDKGRKHGEGILRIENEVAHKVKYDKDKLVEQLD